MAGGHDVERPGDLDACPDYGAKNENPRAAVGEGRWGGVLRILLSHQVQAWCG